MRRAFTILELLAATALTVLLLAAVLHVVATLGRSRSALSQHTSTDTWQYDLLDTLRYDLTSATAVSFSPGKLSLIGHGQLDQTTLVHHHQPVSVSYSLITIHGHRWLVRRQQRRDTQSDASPWTELICPDVTAFIIQPASHALTGPVPTSTDDTPTQAVPPAVSISIAGPSGPILDQTLVLR